MPRGYLPEKARITTATSARMVRRPTLEPEAQPFCCVEAAEPPNTFNLGLFQVEW